MNLTIREFLEKQNIRINRDYRVYTGIRLSRFSIQKKIRYEKVQYNQHFENAYPIEVLEEYFKNNPIPIKNDDCEPINIEMIKLLPIKLFPHDLSGENLTTDGSNIFLGRKWIGYWKS